MLYVVWSIVIMIVILNSRIYNQKDPWFCNLITNIAEQSILCKNDTQLDDFFN